MAEADSHREQAAAEDAELIAQVADGDLETPLGRLIDRHARRVYAIGLKTLGEPEAATKLVRRTFVTLWRAADRIDPARGSVAAYVQSIARRAAIAAHDREAPPEARPPELSDGDRAPYTRLLAELELRDALETLPDHHRQVLELTYAEELPVDEIADRLDVPGETVVARTDNALRSLRRLLGTSVERVLLPAELELSERHQLDALGEELRSAPPLPPLPDGLRERTLIAIDEVAATDAQARAEESRLEAEAEAEAAATAAEAEMQAAEDESYEESEEDDPAVAAEPQWEGDPGAEAETGAPFPRGPEKPWGRRALDAVGDVAVNSTRGQRLAAAAALIAVVLLIVVLGTGGEGGLELEGELTGEDASAPITVRESGAGRAIELDTGGLPELGEGEYYELWFVGGEGGRQRSDRVSAGTFRPDPDETEISLFVAADPSELPRIEITAEPADGNPRPSRDVVASSAE